MRRAMMWTGALVLAAACSSPGTPVCGGVQQVVAPSSSSEPGTLQYGVLHSRDTFVLAFGSAFFAAAVAPRSDGGVVCVTCNGILALDAALHETGRVDTSGPTDIAVAPDDAVYAVVSGTLLRIDDLAHVSTADEVRWMAPVGADRVLVAGTEGPYVGPGTDFTIRGFDAVTGAPRTVASGQYLLAAARGGGVFTVEEQGKQSATLRRLDPAGTVVWSHTLTSMLDGLSIDGAVAAADGGVSVFGSSSSAVDFGDRTLSSPGTFVAGFDASGATQWAFSSATSITRMALTAHGEILLASNTAPGGGEGILSTDAFLSVATPDGVSRTLYITGQGDQFLAGLAATPDGFAWIEIGNFQHDDLEPAPVMHIGDYTFTDPGYYLFKIVP